MLNTVCFILVHFRTSFLDKQFLRAEFLCEDAIHLKDNYQLCCNPSNGSYSAEGYFCVTLVQ